MQVLLIEDDRRISDFIIKGLEENQFQVTLASSAETALENYMDLHWDVILVDVMLPGMDGIQFTQTIRYKKNNTPILILSALNATVDKVTALDFGADDYMTKPFHFDELLSRIKALSRRSNHQRESAENHIIKIKNITVDTSQYKVYLDQEQIELSPREFKLLAYLIQNKNKAVTRMQILNAVWGIQFDNKTNVVDVYISYLRSKLETPETKCIQTVKGIGYLLED